MWTDMIALDWVLVALMIVFTIIGYANGFIAGLLSLAGFVGGAVLGLVFVPRLLSGFSPGLGTALVALLLVLLAASLGQWGLGSIGERIRERFGAPVARRIDGFGGAVVGLAGFVVVAWFVGSAVSSAAIPGVSMQARNSVILRTVDESMPLTADSLREEFRAVVASAGFPEVVAPFVVETVPPADEPDTGVLASDEIRLAASSVVRVGNDSKRCNQTIEGSGVVVGDGRVLTNAHVVAGSDSLTATAPGDGERKAQLVYFDPRTDVAVLDVPGLQIDGVALGTGLAPGDSAVVVGYPGGDRLRKEAARTRGELELVGLDIYGEERVLREVVSLRTSLRPGNSGGPVLSEDGEFNGLVFAASLTSQDTGYALALGSLDVAIAEAGKDDVRRVKSGPCV